MVIGVADHLEIWNTEAWADHDAEIDATAAEIAEELAHGAPGTAAESRGAGAEMATLTYMPTEHVPVLASELIELLDPDPAETAVDCTFGGGGHARLVGRAAGGRRAPSSASTAIPRRSSAFDELADELECETRFMRADFADALVELAGRGPARRPRLHGPGHLVPPARRRGARLLLHLRRAARHAHGPRPGAVGRGASSTSGPQDRLAGVIREHGDERHARAIARRDRPPPPAGDHGRARRDDSRRGAARLPLRARASGEADLPGDPDRGQRRAGFHRPGAARRLGAAARGRAPGGDLVSFARGPPGEALPRAIAPEAASVRRSSRSAGAGASRRRSCSPGEPSPPPPRRSSATPARIRRACVPRESSTGGRPGDDARNGT